MMAGLDVKREMEEFEKSLPPDFRNKLMSLMAQQAPSTSPAFAEPIEVGSTSIEEPAPNMDVHEARLTILKAVADGRMTPEQAEKLLFT